MIVILQDQLRGGGTERQAIELTAALLRDGQEAALWVARSGGALDDLAASRLGPALSFLNAPQASSHLAAIRALRQRVRSLNGPVCLILMGRWAHVAANCLPSDPAKKLRLVSTIRTSRPLPWLYRRTIRRSELLIANSHWALNRCPGPPERRCVIHNGLSRPALLDLPQKTLPPTEGSKPDRLILLNVARLDPGKGQDDLIRMLPLIEHGGVELWLAGTGPELNRLLALAAKLEVSGQVRFTGFTEDVAALYAAADCFVSASRLDSLPNAAIEAQSAGLPVVSYANFGLPEIVVDGETGYLCDESSPAELAKCVTALIDDPLRRTTFGKAGRARVKTTFDPATQNQRFCEIIRSLADCT